MIGSPCRFTAEICRTCFDMALPFALESVRRSIQYIRYSRNVQSEEHSNAYGPCNRGIFFIHQIDAKSANSLLKSPQKSVPRVSLLNPACPTGFILPNHGPSETRQSAPATGDLTRCVPTIRRYSRPLHLLQAFSQQQKEYFEKMFGDLPGDLSILYMIGLLLKRAY